MFWRPVTAIRSGDTDGNSETEPDPAWTPLVVHTVPSGISGGSRHVRRERAGLYTVWLQAQNQFQVPLAFKGQWQQQFSYYTNARGIHAEEGKRAC